MLFFDNLWPVFSSFISTFIILTCFLLGDYFLAEDIFMLEFYSMGYWGFGCSVNLRIDIVDLGPFFFVPKICILRVFDDETWWS